MHIFARERDYGVNLCLEVSDTGVGMSEAETARIFDRFYKVDKSRGLDSKSFGIGLFIVKSIVDLHHGTITVNSDGDSFTEFTVSLPLDTQTADN